jgi:hypothetical protein
VSSSPLSQEALRIHARYVREVVVAYDLCPWAKGLLEGGPLERRVVLGEQWCPRMEEQTHAHVEDIANHEGWEVSFVIFPQLETTAAAFRSAVSKQELLHAEDERGAVPLAMAAFHPEASAHLDDPHRLVPFLRRSPDPTIQLVRRDALARARRKTDEGSTFVNGIEAFLALQKKKPEISVAQRIAEANLRTVSRHGADHFEAIFDEIARDRAQSYARCQ